MSGASRYGAGPGASRRLGRVLAYVPVRWGWFATETHLRPNETRDAIGQLIRQSIQSLGSLPSAIRTADTLSSPILDPNTMEPVLLDGARCLVVMQDGRPRGPADDGDHYFVAGNKIRIAVVQGAPTMVGIDRDTGFLSTFDGPLDDPMSLSEMAIVQGRTAHLMGDPLSYQTAVMLRHPAHGTPGRSSMTVSQSNALDDVAAHVEAFARSVRSISPWSFDGTVDEVARQTVAADPDRSGRSGHDPHMHVATRSVSSAMQTVPHLPGLDLFSRDAGLDYMRWSSPVDGRRAVSTRAVERVSTLLRRQRGSYAIAMTEMVLRSGHDDEAIVSLRRLVSRSPSRHFAPIVPQLRIVEHGLLEVAVVEGDGRVDVTAFVTRLSRLA